MTGSDGDRIDNSTPSGAGGVSDVDLTDTNVLIASIDTAVADLKSKIAIANAAVEKDLSWAQVFQNFAQLAELIVPMVVGHIGASGAGSGNSTGGAAVSSGGASASGNIGQTVLSALGSVLAAPPTARLDTALSALSGLFGKVKL